MDVQVLKFGGSSFPELSSYHDIATLVRDRLQAPGGRIVVVVSAMSGTTGRLLETGMTLHPDLSGEVKDTLLASGEIVAASLLRIALERLDVSVTHLTGYQLGFRTNSTFNAARLVDMDPTELRKALLQHEVVVVAGGQAVDASGRLTMLGRNSSDLSAVAIAAALGTRDCEIFSDVPGVFSTDPYLIGDARCFPTIPYQAIIDMALSGAKVLHHGAVRLAQKYGVRIVCRSTQEGHAIGTIVGAGPIPPSVTLFSKNVVFVAENHDDREVAFAALKAGGVEAIPVSCPFEHALVAWLDGPDPERLLGSLELDLTKPTGWSLVTIISKDGHIARELVRHEKAADFVKAAHQTLYPTGTFSGAILEKRRSSLSGLMVGA